MLDNDANNRSFEGDADSQEGVEPVNPNLPIRQYLDKHIMPSLLAVLEKMTKDKPEDPIRYIGEALLREEDNVRPANN